MLTTHIQQKIDAQTTRGIPVAKIVLARSQFEGLLSNMSRILGFAKLRLQTSKLNLAGNLKNLTAIREIPVVKSECILPTDDVRIGLLNILAECEDEFFFTQAAHKLGAWLDTAQYEHFTSRRFEKITCRTSADADLNDRITLFMNIPVVEQEINLSIFEGISDAIIFNKLPNLTSHSRIDSNFFFPHTFFDDLRKSPILGSLLDILTNAFEYGSPLFLSPDALGHRELSVSRLHLQILTHNLKRDIRRARLKRYVRSRLHHIDVHSLGNRRLTSCETERRPRSEIMFVEDAKKRGQIGFLYDASFERFNTALHHTKGIHGAHLQLLDHGRLLLLKSCHDVVLGHSGCDRIHAKLIVLNVFVQKTHNARRCLIFQCRDLELGLESRDSHASHTSIFKTSLSVHDL